MVCLLTKIILAALLNYSAVGSGRSLVTRCCSSLFWLGFLLHCMLVGFCACWGCFWLSDAYVSCLCFVIEHVIGWWAAGAPFKTVRCTVVRLVASGQVVTGRHSALSFGGLWIPIAWRCCYLLPGRFAFSTVGHRVSCVCLAWCRASEAGWRGGGEGAGGQGEDCVRAAVCAVRERAAIRAGIYRAPSAHGRWWAVGVLTGLSYELGLLMA